MDATAQLNTALSGRYEIEREIGRGGMATVYLARDIKHQRKVALKVLNPELGAVLGVDRFLSEIRVTANLQHPNLLPLFDSGEADGLLFYVMPFVEGESLRARLARETQLPIDEVVRLSVAIAGALDYAHRHGVIHRDLKPENILLHDGQPLIADFGIALAVSNAGGGRVTQTGLSLGTPQYMSPEQATGDRGIDGRTDIYSLGAITYEMLAGEPPHVGATAQAIIARLMTEDPRPLHTVRRTIPPYVDAAVQRALEKLPADRFATAHDFADALTHPQTAPAWAGGTAGIGSTHRARRTQQVLIAAVAAAVLVATGAWATVLLRRTPLEREIRFPVATPETGAPNVVSVSPDGRFVAFIGNTTDGKAAIWIRPMATTVARPIVTLAGLGTPLFWSPDSRYIGFLSDRKLRKVDVTGGPPQSLCDIPIFSGGTWNRDGVIVFSSGVGKLYRVPAAGGTPTELLKPDSSVGQSRLVHPWFLPDGRHFLFEAWSDDPGKRAVYAGDLKGGKPSRILAAEGRPVYVAGELLVQRDGAVLAMPFDAKGLRVTGEPVRVADGVSFQPLTGVGAFDASEDVFAYRTGNGQLAGVEPEWIDRTGKVVGRLEAAPYNQVRLSPDNRHVALTRRNPQTGLFDVWTVDLATGIPTRLTFDSSSVTDPVWMPDSKGVVYGMLRGGKRDIYQKAIGAATSTPLFQSPAEVKYPEDVSADGRFLLFHEPNELYAVPTSGDQKVITLTKSNFGKDEGRFSPDGKSVSYGSDESGTWEVYAASFPAFDNRRQISLHGGRQGRWRADGKEFFYLAPDGKLMSAAIKPGPVPEFQSATVLFQSPILRPSATVDQYDVVRDGKRFLFLAQPHADGSSIDPLTVVVNWRAALKK
jgi:eukaryotic-like serine/threonine-protein kinase